MTPLPGDIGLVDIRGGSWGTRLVSASIRRLTHSRWSHAVTFLGDLGDGVDHLGEAQPGGYAINPVSEYDPASMVWLQVPYSDAQRGAVPSVARGLVGVPYSFLDIVALGLALSTKIRTPKWAARRLSRPDRLICSQACVWIDHALGGSLFDDRLPGEVSPGDLGRAGLVMVS